MIAAILLVFFASGLVSLVYEVVWMRQLALIFGATTYAVAAILAVFVGGLAIGSQLFGRLSDRVQRPLLAYAALELGVGIYALLVPALFDALRTPYVALYAMGLSHGMLAIARGLLAATVLLPPTILMGGTLPLLAKLVIRLRGNVGRQVALLYFVNTAGAVAGCTLAGFVLIERMGISGTIHVGATINFALAGFAVLMHARLPSSPTTAASTGPASIGEATSLPPAAARLVLVCIGLSGFTSLAYESFWARALLRYLYNSTYAFTTMLAVFLAGIALGSWLYLILPLRRTRPLALFALLEIGVGLGFVLSAHLFVGLEGISNVLLGGTISSFGDTLRALVTQTALILFLPSLLLGATVPLATDLCTRNADRAGSTVGRVYAVNTIGAILGTLAITFVLIPSLGM